MKHTQEPWTFEDRSPEGVCHIRNADGHRMAFAPCADFSSRIVACVNACSGMEDPAAELARLRRVERAARAVLEWADPYSIPGDVAIPDAEQAPPWRSTTRQASMRLAYTILRAPATLRVHWTLYIMPDGVTWHGEASTETSARAVIARMVRAWRKAQREWRNRHVSA